MIWPRSCSEQGATCGPGEASAAANFRIHFDAVVIVTSRGAEPNSTKKPTVL